MSSLFSLDNEAFGSLVLYGSLALAKTSFMSFLTSRARMKYKAMVNPEDAKKFAPNDKEKQKLITQPNENVERVRRAHMNDLENVIPFVILGILYVGTNPSPVTALWHFRLFLGFRLLHSIAYLSGISGLRSAGFGGGILVFLSMFFRTVAATTKFF